MVVSPSISLRLIHPNTPEVSEICDLRLMLDKLQREGMHLQFETLIIECENVPLALFKEVRETLGTKLTVRIYGRNQFSQDDIVNQYSPDDMDIYLKQHPNELSSHYERNPR